jgi:hypothetical protein
MTSEDLKKYNKLKEDYIAKLLVKLDKDVNSLQKKLFEQLMEKYLNKFVSENRKLTKNVDNFKLINNLDNIFSEFNRQFGNDIIKEIGEKIIQATALTDNYWRDGINVSDATFASMKENTKWIYERLGITEQGNIIAGSYLDNLAKMPEVQTKIRNYITNNVVSGAGITAFQKGVKDLIVGTKDAPGVVLQYHKQYTFDVFNQVDQAINNTYADTLGLEYFIYLGTIIDTSRCFCVKRAGNVYHKSDAMNWKNDASLLSWYKKNPYNPLIDRGGFNCRHEIQWIPESMAKRLNYNKATANDIIDEECPEN